LIPCIPVPIGFLLEGIFFKVIDKIIPHIYPNLPPGNVEGPKTKLKKSNLLVLAITIHNIPEGLAIGVAFGAASLGLPEATLGAAISLAIGIGLQNFPEGFAVSMPLKQRGIFISKKFFYG
jgi:zinc transporter, ZIP family